MNAIRVLPRMLGFMLVFCFVLFAFGMLVWWTFLLAWIAAFALALSDNPKNQH